MGPDVTIFMDVDGIPPGEDFGRYIDQSVGRCDALIALIGPAWTGSSEGGRRIDQPTDFVRLEVAAALKRGIRVIPLLVDAAKLPQATDLPPDLDGLVDRQAVEMENANWEHGMDRLVASFDTRVPVLGVTPDRLDFGTLRVNSPWPRRTLQLRNTGGGDLRPSVTTVQSWIVVHHRGDMVDVLLDTSYVGDQRGEITIASAGGRAVIEVVTQVVESFPDPHTDNTPPSTQNWGPQPTSPTAGAPPPRNPPPWPQYAQQGAATLPPFTPTPYPAPKISSHLAASILALILFPLTGIFALVYALKVSSLVVAGNIVGAQAASKTARTWSILSIVVAVLFWILYGIGQAGGSTTG